MDIANWIALAALLATVLGMWWSISRQLEKEKTDLAVTLADLAAQIKAVRKEQKRQSKAFDKHCEECRDNRKLMYDELKGKVDK